MSVFTNPPLVPQPPFTLERLQARAAQRLSTTAKTQYAALCRMQKDGIAAIWANREGLTPQQVCDAVGANAGKLIQAHGALTAAIITAANLDGTDPDIGLPTHAYTVNPDGTVTVLAALAAP